MLESKGIMTNPVLVKDVIVSDTTEMITSTFNIEGKGGRHPVKKLAVCYVELGEYWK